MSDIDENEENTESVGSNLGPPPEQPVQSSAAESTDIATDEDYYSDGSMRQRDDDGMDEEDDDDFIPMGMAGHHRRNSSLAEKRESIHRQKEEMEKKLRSLSQKLDQELDEALDEFDEMDQINQDKTVFSDLFDKIDPEDNGDVDEKEWIAGLKRMRVDMNEVDMGKLFRLMDGDKSGYIDRQDWITFCMSSYSSKEMQRLHDSILVSVKGHSRKPSNMINPKGVGDWSLSAINQLEKQMTQAFLQQGSEVLEKQEEEEEYLTDMARQAHDNPDWTKPERAMEWTPKEVAFWLDSIELSQYARKFDEEPVDGSMLLCDCDRNLLQMEMGIKPLHVGKILREVDKLRKLNKDELQDSYRDWNELIEENAVLIQRIDEQTKDINELQTENAELRLKAMNVAPPQKRDDDEDDDVALGPNSMETTNGNYEEMGGLATEYKTDNDPLIEIKSLRSEIEHLHKQKILFAQNTASEMFKLNQIIRVLSKEHTALTTPYYKKFNPIDSLIRSLGYQPTQ